MAGPVSVSLPGFVNALSHAFHRALRGASESGPAGTGDFWTWRSFMYSVADRLDPDSYRELATCVYAEMLLAGFTAVGEFHYLHHGPGGVPYADPNEMSWALVDAAEAAGIRLTLLDTCYLQAGVGGEPLEGVQLRFGDSSGEQWSGRASAALDSGRFGGSSRLGAAIHSVRAVGRPAMETVAAWAATEDTPLHVHLSEQRKENADCLSAMAMTPTDLLGSVGAISSRLTAVHATHLTATDVTRLGLARCGVCACPTTERDLGDGVGPFADLADSGAVMSIGSDSHAVIDPFEETRSLESHQRLTTERRGIMSTAALLEAGSTGGARALGWSEADCAGDTVMVRLDRRPALAGAGGASADRRARVLYCAGASDVDTVTVGGRVVVEGGEHATLGPRSAIAERLSTAIAKVLPA